MSSSTYGITLGLGHYVQHKWKDEVKHFCNCLLFFRDHFDYKGVGWLQTISSLKPIILPLLVAPNDFIFSI